MKKLFVLLLTLALTTCIPALAEEELSLGSTSCLIALAVLMVLMLVGLYFSTRRVKWNASMIAKAAICIAMAYILNQIELFRMPMGGSVTPIAMLPLILFAMAFGPLEGLLVGCVYGLMKLILNPYIVHPVQMLADYPMAYAALALACLANKLHSVRLRLPIGVLLGYLGRYVISVLSGVVFFAEYAGDQAVLLYSLTYNIGYLWPEIVAGMGIALIPAVSRLPEMLRRNNMR